VACVILLIIGALAWPATKIFFGLATGAILYHAVNSIQRARKRRFRHSRFQAHWDACRDRRKRLDDSLKRLAKSGQAELTQLPKTVDSVNSNLYVTLRRADDLLHEITESEAGLLPDGRNRIVMTEIGRIQVQREWDTVPQTNDVQAKELYRVAGLNNQEYRQRLDQVMGMIERAEAQAAVYISALDSLRIKLLGLRLGPDDQASKALLESMTEAKMQLDAIDKALDELELTPYPKTITLGGTLQNDSSNSAQVNQSSHQSKPSHPRPSANDLTFTEEQDALSTERHNLTIDPTAKINKETSKPDHSLQENSLEDKPLDELIKIADKAREEQKAASEAFRQYLASHGVQPGQTAPDAVKNLEEYASLRAKSNQLFKNLQNINLAVARARRQKSSDGEAPKSKLEELLAILKKETPEVNQSSDTAPAPEISTENAPEEKE
jgi:hypothetical protein